MSRLALTRGASAGAIAIALLAGAETGALAQTPLPDITIAAARRTAPTHSAPADTPAVPTQPAKPIDATIIDQRQIAEERPAAVDTVQLLRNTPGVSWYEAGGVSRLPAIHGLADDRLNVLVSGIPAASACANHMNPPLSYVSPSQVGNIRVYSGVVPVSVGGDSIGGAIVVDPPSPVFASSAQPADPRGPAANEPPHFTFNLGGSPILTKGEIGAFYRSNGNGYGGHLSATAASDRFSITYNGAYARSENYHAAAAFKPAGYAFPFAPLPLTRSNQFVPWLSGSEVGSTAYQTQNHDVNLAFRHENHLLQVNVGFQHIPYQNFPNQRMDMTLNRTVQGSVRYNGQYDWGLLEGQFYHQTVRHGMDFGNDKQFYYGALNNILAPGMPMETKAQNTGVKAKASIPLFNIHNLRVGAEYQQYRYNEWWPPSPFVLPPGRTVGGMAPAAFIAINDGRRDRFDAFAELESRWSPQWLTLVGVRSDTVWMNAGPVHGYNVQMYDSAPLFPATIFNLSNRARTDQNWNATAQATYTPNADWTFSLGYSLKSRSPNLYERYSWSPATMPAEMIGWFGDGNFYIGNLNLKPEVANTISATADWHDEANLRGIRFTPYFTYVSNFIDVQRCPLHVCGNTPALRNNLVTTYGFAFLQFVNQDARLFGADLSGHAVLAQNTPLGDFTGRAMLSYVNGQNIATGGNLYQIMPVNAKLSLEQRYFGLTNAIEMQVVGAKANIEQVRNELKTYGYTLFNWRSSYEWRNVRFDVGVENIFNAFYYQPLGGAYVGYGATMSGNGAGAPVWGIPVPGMGRSVYVATNVKF